MHEQNTLEKQGNSLFKINYSKIKIGIDFYTTETSSYLLQWSTFTIIDKESHKKRSDDFYKT